MHHNSDEKNVSVKNIIVHLNLQRCHVLRSLMPYKCSLCSSSFQKNPINGSTKIASTTARIISTNNHVQSRALRIFSFAVFTRKASHLWNIVLSVYHHQVARYPARRSTSAGTVTIPVLSCLRARGFLRGIHADNRFRTPCRYGHYDNPKMI